jgi:steroid delta-isomerase-like uncharacterized protein
MVMGLSEADMRVATLRHADAITEGLRQQRSSQHRTATPLESGGSHVVANDAGRADGNLLRRQEAWSARRVTTWKVSVHRFAAVVALLLTVAGSILTGVAAQEATPAIADPAVAELAMAYTDAWSSGDVRAVSALYTDDASFAELVLGGVVTQGHGELEGYAGAAFAAFSDFAITVHDGFAAGDRVAIEWVLSGRYTGQFGDLPPGTGQAVEVPGASVLILEDGQIAEQREYWDVATLLAQVGALPGPTS